MIKITGRINNNKSTKLLVIHSKNLTNEIRKKGQKVRLENFNDGLIIKNGNEIHTTLVQNKRIQIAIGNLIKNNKINPDIINRDTVDVYLNLKDWKLKEISQKSRGSPITNELPDNLIAKKAGLRTNKRNRYFIDISSKKLFEIAKKETIRCLINRKENLILIKSNKLSARKLTPHGKGRIQIAIPKEILKKEEIINLSEKSWIPIYIELNLKSFGLSLPDFYSNKEEKELAQYFTKKNIKIKIKDYTDPYDMYLPEYNIGIEVHNSLPALDDFVTRHKVRPAMVRLRILEADFLVRKGNLKKFLLILNKKWLGSKYIKELTENINKNIIIFYTDFRKGWPKNIEDEIIKIKQEVVQ